MKEFSDDLKKGLLECNPLLRTLIALFLEGDVNGLLTEEVISRAVKFNETGDIEGLSVKSAGRLRELYEKFDGDLKLVAYHLVEN